MPQAAFLIVPASLGSTVSIAGVTVATGSGLTLAGVALSTGAAVLFSVASQKLLAPRSQKFGPESLKIATSSEIQARVAIMGRARVGYDIPFTFAKDGVLHRVIVHSHGESDRIEDYYLLGALVTLDADGFVQEDQYQHLGQSMVRLESRLGAASNDHYQALTADIPEWSASHQGNGLTHTYMRAELPSPQDIQAMYPDREPQLSATVRGPQVLDPRTGLKLWSQNLALQALDFELSPDGSGIPANLVDVDGFAAAADICDIPAELSGGGTEPTYQFHGTRSLAEPVVDVRARLALACGGEYWQTPSGKISLRVGSYEPPRFTITYDMLLPQTDIVIGADPVEGFNTVQFTYDDPSLNFARVSGASVVDADRLAIEGELPEQIFIASPSHRQCEAAAKAHMFRNSPVRSFVLFCKPKALPAIFEPRVRVLIPELGIDGDFRVATHSVDSLTLAVTLTVSEYPEEANLHPVADHGSPQIPAAIASSSSLAAPTGFAVGPIGIQGNSASPTAGLIAIWDERPRVSLAPVLKIAEAGSDNFSFVPVSEDATSVVIPGLSDGQAYDVELYWRTSSGARTAGAVVLGIVATAVPSPPPAPDQITAEESGLGEVTVTVTAADDPTLFEIDIIRDGVIVKSYRSDPSEVYEFIDSAGAGVFAYEARSRNLSNLPSVTNAGPATVSLSGPQ